MKTKFNLLRLSIFSLLVLIFPLVQNQWLNLYLFDKYNFTFYKLLYYLSGLIFPLIVINISINSFTNYNFRTNKEIPNKGISGLSLLILTLTSLISLASFISSYILINLNLFSYLFINKNPNIVNLDFNKLIVLLFIICILLFFKRIKFLIKKIVLIIYFLSSFIIWYSQLNNILINDNKFNIFINTDYINTFNILFLLTIEILYYLWSYISYGSYLSDWKLPVKLSIKDSQIFNIIFFYLMIVLYYSQLSN